jgi:xylulokinase
VATDWAADVFGLDHAGVEAALRASPPGARGASFLPHLGGERTPNCPTGAGVFAGLRADHTSADLVRAVVEGVTFGLQYAVDALRRAGVSPIQLTLVGGGAASDGWAQLCADVFEIRVVRPLQIEAAAIGAARQARWVVDGIPASRGPAVDGQRFEPNPSDAVQAACRRAAHLREVVLQQSL